MQNRPFKTPIFCLAIHLGITIIFICAPPAGDAFDFVVGLGTYPTVFLLTLVTIGLIKLRLDKDDNFQSSFKVPWAILGFYLAGNTVSQVFPARWAIILLTLLVPTGYAFCPASQRKGKHESSVLVVSCCCLGYINHGSHLLCGAIYFATLGIWL
jgi:amino acid transporter